MTPRTVAFAWVSFAMIVGVMGTALVSPLYALYAQAWQLRPSDVSLIYVLYMGGALCGLLFLGRMPDRIGFKTVMLWGLALALIGTLMSMVAWDMLSLIVGRIVVGLSSTMLATSATAGFAALAGPGQHARVAMLSGLLMAFGFGLGPLVGGIMGQWVPSPLRSTYLPPLLLGVVGWWALYRLPLPETSVNSSAHVLNWRDFLPTLTWTDRASSSAFVLTSSLPFIAFGVFGLYASMAPLFLEQLVPWHGPMVSGSALASILLASAVVQAFAWRMPTHWCGLGGMGALALSNALLIVNLHYGSAWLFVGGVLLTSLGHGLSQLAGMSMVAKLASPNKRSALLSSYLVIGYLGCILPIMCIGWMADHWGMDRALQVFCGATVTGSVLVGALFFRHPRTQPTRT